MRSAKTPSRSRREAGPSNSKPMCPAVSPESPAHPRPTSSSHVFHLYVLSCDDVVAPTSPPIPFHPVFSGGLRARAERCVPRGRLPEPDGQRQAGARVCKISDEPGEKEGGAAWRCLSKLRRCFGAPRHCRRGGGEPPRVTPGPVTCLLYLCLRLTLVSRTPPAPPRAIALSPCLCPLWPVLSLVRPRMAASGG